MCCIYFFFFFKQKTAYEVRISDWSSDVCSSDLLPVGGGAALLIRPMRGKAEFGLLVHAEAADLDFDPHILLVHDRRVQRFVAVALRSEEHTSELQSLMRISYAVFCLKKKKTTNTDIENVQ